jgi:hypothetical protein
VKFARGHFGDAPRQETLSIIVAFRMGGFAVLPTVDAELNMPRGNFVFGAVCLFDRPPVDAA